MNYKKILDNEKRDTSFDNYMKNKYGLDVFKRYYVIAPNGEKVSVIYSGCGYWQTWSLKRKQWESFPANYMKILKQA